VLFRSFTIAGLFELSIEAIFSPDDAEAGH
jgi:hypothetical protein